MLKLAIFGLICFMLGGYFGRRDERKKIARELEQLRGVEDANVTACFDKQGRRVR